MPPPIFWRASHLALSAQTHCKIGLGLPHSGLLIWKVPPSQKKRMREKNEINYIIPLLRLVPWNFMNSGNSHSFPSYLRNRLILQELNKTKDYFSKGKEKCKNNIVLPLNSHMQNIQEQRRQKHRAIQITDCELKGSPHHHPKQNSGQVTR